MDMGIYSGFDIMSDHDRTTGLPLFRNISTIFPPDKHDCGAAGRHNNTCSFAGDSIDRYGRLPSVSGISNGMAGEHHDSVSGNNRDNVSLCTRPYQDDYSSRIKPGVHQVLNSPPSSYTRQASMSARPAKNSLDASSPTTMQYVAYASAVIASGAITVALSRE